MRVAWADIKIGQSFRFWGSSQSGFRYIKMTETGYVCEGEDYQNFLEWTERGFQTRPSDEVYARLLTPEFQARPDYPDLLMSCAGWLLVREVGNSSKKLYLSLS